MILNLHPIYREYENRWRMAFDFWRGGVHVLSPNRPVSLYHYTDDADDKSKSPIGSMNFYSWRSNFSNSYLFKHEHERLFEYDQRVERAINLPVFQYILNVLTSSILRTPPIRIGAEIEPWATIHKDVDLMGTDIDVFNRRVMAYALTFGRCHAIVDMPLFEDTPRSLAEQRERNERAYAYIVNPIDLLDWSVDEYGNYNWVVIKENAPDTRRPGEEYKQKEIRLRVWTRQDWILYSVVDEKERVISSGTHGAGVVPMATCYASRTGEPGLMACETPLADFLDINRYIVNKLSELDQMERMATFDLLCIPSMDGQSAPIDISPCSAITYPSEAGAPTFLSPNPEHPIGKWNRIRELLEEARQYAAVSRGKAERSKEERSAAAISLESEDKRNQLAWWSKSLSEFDVSLHSIMATYEGVESPESNYTKNFDVRALASQINDVVMLNTVQVVNDEVKSALLKPIIRKIMTEHDIDEVVIEKAIKALDQSVIDRKEIEEENREMLIDAAKQKQAIPPGKQANQHGVFDEKVKNAAE